MDLLADRRANSVMKILDGPGVRSLVLNVEGSSSNAIRKYPVDRALVGVVPPSALMEV